MLPPRTPPTMLTAVSYFPTRPGPRALFLIENSSRKVELLARRLFNTVGRIAEVVPIAHGVLIGFAVQGGEDPDLIAKIDRVLRPSCGFYLVEPDFSRTTFELVRSLCEDAGAAIAEIPTCGICETPDPFPARIAARAAGRAESLQRAYCVRCVARNAAVEAGAEVVALLREDGMGFGLSPVLDFRVIPEMVDELGEQRDDSYALAM